jgi:DNA-binding beta-propeller fold protein YncE
VVPDGTTAYVAATGLFPDGTVTPIDTATDKAGPLIPVGEWPAEIVSAEGGRKLYVAQVSGETGGAQGGDIVPIETLTDQPDRRLLPDTAPTSMAITPNGAKLYVTDDGSVFPIDVRADRVGPAIKVDGDLSVMAPSGKVLYVGSSGGRGRTCRGVVVPISTTTDRPGRAINVGEPDSLPRALTISPDGSEVSH